jgi:hypothetical protein
MGDNFKLERLSGNKKILGLAYKIRDKYAEDNPESTILTTELKAEYWVANRVQLIGSERIPKLPALEGKRMEWAFAIRQSFASSFPESSLLHSQTQAAFWLENRRILDFAALGYQLAKAVDAKGNVIRK